MRVSSVRYDRLINVGNFQHSKIGVEILLEDGDTPQDALREARAFIRAEAENETDWAPAWLAKIQAQKEAAKKRAKQQSANAVQSQPTKDRVLKSTKTKALTRVSRNGETCS